MDIGFDYRGDRAFASQFSSDGVDFVYRRNRTGPALPLSAAERDEFIAAFRAGYRKVFWRSVATMVGSMVAIIVAQLALDLPSDGWVAGIGPFVGLLPGLVLLMVSIRRLMAAPAVALALRTPVAAPVPVATFRRTQLAATPWWRFFLPPVYAVFLTWRYDLIADPLAPRHLVFTVLAVGLIALAVVGGVSKWRAGSARVPA